MSLTFKEAQPKDINFRAMPHTGFLTAHRKDYGGTSPQQCILFRKPGYPSDDVELIAFDGIKMTVFNESSVHTLFRDIQGPFNFQTQFKGEVHAEV